MNTHFTDQDQVIALALAEIGYVVMPDFFSRMDWLALRNAAMSAQRAEEFHAAGIGRSAQLVRRDAVRNDTIRWLDSASDEPAVRAWFARVEALRQTLNQTLMLGLFDFESHFAVYAPGHFYRRHIDQFQGVQARAVTLIVYLNDAWRTEHGGALRLYIDEHQWRDILPIGGTCVAFLSECFYHEVLPATRERLSITGWLRRRG